MIPRESKPPRDYEATDDLVIRVNQGSGALNISGRDLPEGRTIDAKRFLEQLLCNLEKKLGVKHAVTGDYQNNEDTMRQLQQQMERIEFILKVILCCTLLPKDGPNWAYFESLFHSAEMMLATEKRSLPEMVESILLNK